MEQNEHNSDFELDDEASSDSASGENNKELNEELTSESEEFELDPAVKRKRLSSSAFIIPSTVAKKRIVNPLGSEELDDENTLTTFVIASSTAAAVVPIVRMFKDDVVTLSDDGRIHINGVLKQQIDSATMVAIRQIGLDTKRLRLSNDVKGYLIVDKTRIHVELAKSRRQSDFEYFTKLGCDAPLSNYVVAHLDDNPLNINLSNLKNVPAKVNAWSRKSEGQVAQQAGGFYSAFRYEGRQVNTTKCTSIEEAMFKRDVLKVKLVPNYAKQFIFDYGLNRPAEYIHRYQSLKSLIAYTHLKTIPLVESSEDVKAAIKASQVPFDSNLDVIVFYKGMHGSSTQFIVEKTCYETLLRDFTQSIRLTSGYVRIGNEQLHLMVLGRKVGEKDKDGLEGCHGPGGKSDNRKRVLRLGSSGSNTADIKRKSKHGYTGVSFVLGKYWEAVIRISGHQFRLGRFKKAPAAGLAHQKVNSHRSDISRGD
ncbi:hypothetical protein HK100_008372 [Physocladia obscura]|uniref:Uncharacterized protein n=1 Tax=Physocladia obscura TaxID=109957 RepID=A0AAD5SQS5_9FUNG|nr:hypothetical protein HK100_008372 [Physocladia obscura]